MRLGGKVKATEMWRSLALALVVGLAVLMSASGAKAGCADGNKAGASPVLSWLALQGPGNPNEPATIVGLWHLKYTAQDGSAFLESFKTWHGDGTEFENAFLPPTGGNICYGVWKTTGRLTYKLHHVGLMFAPDGSLAATFTVDEVNIVAIDNQTYKGTFDFKVYDVGGNVLQEVKGTTAAKRVNVD
jgi:hypothetical protein